VLLSPPSFHMGRRWVFFWIPEFSRGALWAAKVEGGTRAAQEIVLMIN